MATIPNEPTPIDPRSDRASILGTTDQLVAEVPWGEFRSVLVYRREHGGRTYVRLRIFNKHKTKGCRYPTPRGFIIPYAHGLALAAAIEAASRGESWPEPEWYAAFAEQYDARTQTRKPRPKPRRCNASK